MEIENIEKAKNKDMGEDLTELKKACQDYIDFVFSEDYHGDGASDYKNAVFEAAIEAFYGEDIWDKINERIDQVYE